MMLSMFFAILGDAQDIVIDRQESVPEEERPQSVLFTIHVWAKNRLNQLQPAMFSKWVAPVVQEPRKQMLAVRDGRLPDTPTPSHTVARHRERTLQHARS